MSLSSTSDDIMYRILRLVGPSSAVMLAQTSPRWTEKILRSAVSGQLVWKSFAIERWGHAVSLGDGERCQVEEGSDVSGGGNSDLHSADEDTQEKQQVSSVSSWYNYYRHRCSTWSKPPQISHLALIQEQYAHDPYQLLSACILCSRTSGSCTIRTVVRCFLQKYPTPTDVIEADINVMANELHSLGLNRERTMKRFASDFVLPWEDVKELHGCGAFASSSHDVFCKGDWKSVLRDKKADRNVRAYAAFCRRLFADRGDSDAEAEEAREGKERLEVQKGKNKKRRKPPKLRKPLPEKKKRRRGREGSRRLPRNL